MSVRVSGDAYTRCSVARQPLDRFDKRSEGRVTLFLVSVSLLASGAAIDSLTHSSPSFLSLSL